MPGRNSGMLAPASVINCSAAASEFLHNITGNHVSQFGSDGKPEDMPPKNLCDVGKAVSNLPCLGNFSNRLKYITLEPSWLLCSEVSVAWLGLQHACSLPVQMEIEGRLLKMRPTPWTPFWCIRPALLLMSPWPPPNRKMILLQKHWCLDKLQARIGDRPYTTSEITDLRSTEAVVILQDNSSKSSSSRLTTISSEIYGVSDIHKEFEQRPRLCPSFSRYQSKAGANGLNYFEMGANFWSTRVGLKVTSNMNSLMKRAIGILLMVWSQYFWYHGKIALKFSCTTGESHVSSWRVLTLLNVYNIQVLGLNCVYFTEMQQVVGIHWEGCQIELCCAHYCYGRHIHWKAHYLGFRV